MQAIIVEGYLSTLDENPAKSWFSIKEIYSSLACSYFNVSLAYDCPF